MGYYEVAWTSRTNTPRADEGARSAKPGKAADAAVGWKWFPGGLQDVEPEWGR